MVVMVNGVEGLLQVMLLLLVIVLVDAVVVKLKTREEDDTTHPFGFQPLCLHP